MRLAAPNLLLLAAATTAFVAGVADAKSTDRNAPMDIDAGHSDALLTDDGEMVLSGGVTITQGTLEVRSDTATVHRKAGDIQQVVLVGTPATLKQVNDNGEPMDARASRIVYTLDSDIVVLTGGVVVEQTRGTLRGETIKYDLKSGRLDGGGDGKRVQMRILPKNKT
jgi:lipopolysaccharide export system protein LptA